MSTVAIAKVGVTLKFAGGISRTVYEGDLLRGMVYTAASGAQGVLDGTVRVIVAQTRSQNIGPSSCPPEPYVHTYINPTQLIIDASEEFDAKLYRVNVSDIVSIDSVVPADYDPTVINVGPGEQYRALADVIADAPEGSKIALLPGTYGDALTIGRSMKIYGTEKGVVLTGAITAATPDGGNAVSLELENLTLEGDALISATDLKAFSMKNVVFGNHNITKKTMPVAIKGENEILLNIEDCAFTDEPSGSYNLIDVYGQLLDGSTISNNSFDAACCSHNQISLYGLAPGTTVEINGNFAVNSKNLVRIGFKGNPSGTVVLDGNCYDFTDEPPYDGLFLVQPYGRQTESFGDLTIDVKNTVYPTGTQIGYLYAGGNDTPFTDATKPKALLDGELWEIPDSSPEALAAKTKITVTFMSGTEVIGTSDVSRGSAVGLEPVAPTKVGYTFSGWSATEGGTPVDVENYVPESDVTLYAVYTENAVDDDF